MDKESNDSIIRNCLKEIANRNDGQITPEEVFVEAKKLPKDHPLHLAVFNCSSRTAAYHYYIERCRKLLSKHVAQIMVTSSSRVLRSKGPFYVRDPRASSREQGYIAVSTLSKPDHRELARTALIQSYRRVESALESAKHMAVIVGFEDLVEQDLARVRITLSIIDGAKEFPSAA